MTWMAQANVFLSRTFTRIMETQASRQQCCERHLGESLTVQENGDIQSKKSRYMNGEVVSGLVGIFQGIDFERQKAIILVVSVISSVILAKLVNCSDVQFLLL